MNSHGIQYWIRGLLFWRVKRTFMPEHRAREHHRNRVQETLREEIGVIIDGELSDPRIGST